MSETNKTPVAAPSLRGRGIRWPLVLLLAGGTGAAVYGYGRYTNGGEHKAFQTSPLPSLQDTRPLIEPVPVPAPPKTTTPPTLPETSPRIVEPPKAERPKAAAPKVEMPKAEAPKVDAAPATPSSVATPVAPPAQRPVETPAIEGPKDTASPPISAPDAPRVAVPETKPETAPTPAAKAVEPATKAEPPKPVIEQAVPVAPSTPPAKDAFKDAAPAVATPKGPAPATKSADPVTVKLLERGKNLLADGNIAGARLFLERASEAGHAEAALLLGSTFDPAWLATAGAHGTRPEPGKARRWYTEAQRLGSKDAAARLTQLGPGN